MSKFYFGDSDGSDIDDDSLPFPTPLDRSAFLTDDFSPVSFLSTLHNRHQTLEDLRSELRTRSQDLSKELLDLVNSNYQGFLNLGSSLEGGEEKIDQLKVGLLSFRKEVEGVRSAIVNKEREVKQSIEERRALKDRIRLGKTMLRLDGMVEDLEMKLMMGSRDARGDDDQDALDSTDTEGSSDEDEQELVGAAAGFISTSRLTRRVQDYLCIRRLISKVGSEHPFVVAQEHRVYQIRNTLLLDLGTALKQVFARRLSREDQTIRLMQLYREMDAPNEAVRLLRQARAAPANA